MRAHQETGANDGITHAKPKPMIGDLLVPIDGSANSRRALRIAAAIARPLGGELDVICFSSGPITEGFRRSVHRMAQQEAEAVPTHIEVAEQHGPAQRHIASSVASHPASLVCMAAHGHSRSPALLGSVTEAVIDASHRPVLLVGPSVSTATFNPNDAVLLTANSVAHEKIGAGWHILFGSDVLQMSAESALTAASERPTAVIVATLTRQSRTARLRWGDPNADLIHDSPCPVLATDHIADAMPT